YTHSRKRGVGKFTHRQTGQPRTLYGQSKNERRREKHRPQPTAYYTSPRKRFHPIENHLRITRSPCFIEDVSISGHVQQNVVAICSNFFKTIYVFYFQRFGPCWFV